MKLLTRGLFLTAAAATTLFGFTPSAFASPSACTTQTGTGHCEGIAQADLSLSGATMNVRANCLDMGNVNTDFINNEMWLTKGPAWIEAGLSKGHFYQAGTTAGSPVGFTSEYSSVSNTYTETVFGAVNLSSGYNVTIVARPTPPGAWDVHVGAYAVLSHPEFASPGDMATAGAEIATGILSARNTGIIQALTYYNASGTQISGWPGAVAYTAPAAGPPFVTLNGAKTRLDYQIGTAC